MWYALARGGGCILMMHTECFKHADNDTRCHCTITSLLNPSSTLPEVGVMAGSAALVAEFCKHDSNDPRAQS